MIVRSYLSLAEGRTGYFNGVRHSMNGVLLVLISAISGHKRGTSLGNLIGSPEKLGSTKNKGLM